MLTCYGLIFVLWCEQPQKTVVRDYCRIARPLQVSRKDTPATKRAALRHNLTYRRLCRRK
jgi:hypothetical protein